MKKFNSHIISKLFGVVGLVLAIGACDDPYEDSTYINDENKAPLALTMEQDSLATEWVQVLKFSGMYDALNYALDPFTVFLPTNDAVRSFYAQRGVSSIEELGKDFARAMVQMHTVEDSMKVADIISKPYLTNLLEAKVNIGIDTLNAGELIITDEANTSSANVVEREIPAYNGYIYRVNSVINPLVETVYDRVFKGGLTGDANRYSIFAEVLESTGFSTQLSKVSDTIAFEGAQIVSRNYFTVFAVPNEAYQKENIHSLPELKNRLMADAEGAGANVDSLLFMYAAYHVIPNSLDWTTLITPVSTVNDANEFTGDSTFLYDTLIEGNILSLSRKGAVDAPQYIFNEQASSATLVRGNSNVLARNGFLHEVDGYLPVWIPLQTAVTWDLAAYSSVKSVVELDKDGGADIYQPKDVPSSETAISIISSDAYSFENTGIEAGKYPSIAYVTCTKNWAAAYNYDRVAFNLGYMGWVAMQTPTLVRGKYRVELDFIYNSLTQQFMKNMTNGSNGGLIKMTFDDAHEQMASPYTTITGTKNGVYSTVLYDEIEFEETASHQFKFVIMDPAAGNNKNFYLQFDCIRFIPITE